MFDEMYEAFSKAASEDQIKEILKKFKNEGIDALNYHDTTFPFYSVVEKLAFDNKPKVVNYLLHLGANIDEAICGYVSAKNNEEFFNLSFRLNHEEFIRYLAMGYAKAGYFNSIDLLYIAENYMSMNFAIAEGYAIAGRDDKVNELLNKFESEAHKQEIIDSIAIGYARAGNHKKAQEFIERGANVISVYYNYAYGGHHALVDELVKIIDSGTKASLIVKAFSDGYKDGGYINKSAEYASVAKLIDTNKEAKGVLAEIIREGYINKFGEYAAVAKLINSGEKGSKILAVIKRLKEGEQSKFNPYWANSGKKVEAIIKAVNETLSNESDLNDSLEKALKDENSPLYRALNTHRLAHFTFLGKKPGSKCKSLLDVEEQNKPSGIRK